MRSLVCVLITLVVSSCELKPGPKQKEAPPAPAAAPTAGSAAAPAPSPPSPPPGAPAPAATADAGVAPPAPAGNGSAAAAAPAEPTSECLQLGAHIAEILISGADPTQQPQLEQQRTKIVRRSAEACTRDGWNAESKACFLAATTAAAMQECGKKLRAP